MHYLYGRHIWSDIWKAYMVRYVAISRKKVVNWNLDNSVILKDFVMKSSGLCKDPTDYWLLHFYSQKTFYWLFIDFFVKKTFLIITALSINLAPQKLYTMSVWVPRTFAASYFFRARPFCGVFADFFMGTFFRGLFKVNGSGPSWAHMKALEK